MAAPTGSRKDRSEDIKRVAVALVGIPLALFCVIRGGIPFLLLIGVFGHFALREFTSMALTGCGRFRGLLVSVTGLAYILAGYFDRLDTVPAILLASMALVGLMEIRAAAVSGAITRVAKAVLGPLYVCLTLSFALLIRGVDGNGVYVIIYVLMLTWMTDSAAYFVGRRFGRHKLSPVSPKKSVEGSIGGLVGANLMGLLFIGFLDLGIWEMLVLSTVISLSGQVGDLFESLLKRDAGVKDSSRMIPGHGGFLDRIDSLLFTVPTAYCILKLLG